MSNPDQTIVYKYRFQQRLLFEWQSNRDFLMQRLLTFKGRRARLSVYAVYTVETNDTDKIVFELNYKNASVISIIRPPNISLEGLKFYP